MTRKAKVTRAAVVGPRARLLHALADQYEAGRRAIVEKFRPAYLAELETFAETLRPRFEAGELYGCRPQPGDDADCIGEERLERAAETYFGLEITEGPFRGGRRGSRVGDELSASAIMALSPAAEAIGYHELSEYAHPCLGARECIVWDVLSLARARRWYRPAQGEAPTFVGPWARRAA